MKHNYEIYILFDTFVLLMKERKHKRIIAIRHNLISTISNKMFSGYICLSNPKRPMKGIIIGDIGSDTLTTQRQP